MNKREKEVLQAQLDSEKKVLQALERQYQKALKDIMDKTKILQTDIEMLQAAGESDDKTLSMVRSKVFQKQYQEALQAQITAVLDKLHSDEFSTIQGYLNGCYEDAYIGTMYDIHGQGIPLILPIDQNAAVKAIQLDSKISKGLYTSLGVDTKKLKKSISQEVTRGIATGLSYADIARNISNASKAPLSRARTISRTEAHRIQQASTMDAQKASKAKGADVVKQWDSTLDGATRKTHRKLDGQIREVDEPFEVNGNKTMAPGHFGDPAEDCNCRCVSLTRARWALDEDELKTLQDRAKFFELDKTKDFEEFKAKYLKSAKTLEKSEENGKMETGATSGALTDQNDPNGKKRKAHAEKYYDSIRNSDIQQIAAKVSENSGITKETVGVAINHLFVEKHDLEDGHIWFHADYDIAESMRRLREGKDIQQHDLTLLMHEAMEAEIMKTKGLTYEEAHAETEKTYNYALELMEFKRKQKG